ncbi:MAG: hypothetical protein JSR81_11035 [Proteobacteria bacterium]|nr:hypothetical protein [Pseudomonadota bacterium]
MTEESNDAAATVADFQGGLMHLQNMVHSMMACMVKSGIMTPQAIVDMLDEMVMQWEMVAATPGHANPEATANAMARADRLLVYWRGKLLAADSGAGQASPATS